VDVSGSITTARLGRGPDGLRRPRPGGPPGNLGELISKIDTKRDGPGTARDRVRPLYYRPSVRDDRLPVLLGVGQVLGNRDRTVAGAREPLRLVADAVSAAGQDTGAGTGGRLLREVDSIAVSHVASWGYDDLAAKLAERIGAGPSHTFAAPVGGQWPVALVDTAAARIAAGESRVALVAGGEASASMVVLARAGVDPAGDLGWSAEPGGQPGFDPDDLGSAAMQLAGLVLPTRVYPMVDAALTHALGESPAQAQAWSAELYAGLSEVASKNPCAWNPMVTSPSDILRVGPVNRMICEPYPLSLNANPLVDMAAAVVMTSVAVAREHGVPDERMVHVWGGAGAEDAADVVARPDLAVSPALASALDRTLAAGGLATADLDVLDVYTPFPVVPRLVGRHLGLALPDLLGVTGGYSSFGGPLSSYGLHAVVATARRLRAGARTALVHGGGGYLTRQHAVLLGRSAHEDGYVGDPVPKDTAEPGPAPVVLADGDVHEVRVEAGTVEYDRNGLPTQGFLLARTPDGRRLAAATPRGDAASTAVLTVFPDGPTAPPGPHAVGRTVRATVIAGHAQLDPV
jgi:acetyl-CoA C-acetyltransferase